MAIEHQGWDAFFMDHMLKTQEINAAIVNISGRQRMLSQRVAMFCLRLVTSQQPTERELIRQHLGELAAVMEESHQGLIEGNEQLHLPGNPSEAVKAMYFQPPWQVDQKVRNYIAEVRALLGISDAELTLENPHLKYIVDAASTDLLIALDQVVNQYQQESEQEQQAIAAQQIELYSQSCAAAEAAQAQAEELKQALGELNTIQVQLIQTEKMSSLGQLVAGVAHEINNPVNFIYGNLSHVQEYAENLLGMVRLYQENYPEPPTEIQQEAEEIDLEFLQADLPKILQSMKLGTERIRQIVLSLRNFSRTDESECKGIDIHEGIDSTLLILQHRLKAKPERSEIQVIRDYGCLPLVECYPGQLNQVFMNILSNAIDALEERHAQDELITGQVPLNRITIRTVQLKGQWVEIAIADNGTGIPEALQQKIFNPFFTTKPVGKGTGLGMAICHQIIAEKHGGKITCLSTPGAGTEFVIQIPIALAVASAG